MSSFDCCHFSSINNKRKGSRKLGRAAEKRGFPCTVSLEERLGIRLENSRRKSLCVFAHSGLFLNVILSESMSVRIYSLIKKENTR